MVELKRKKWKERQDKIKEKFKGTQTKEYIKKYKEKDTNERQNNAYIKKIIDKQPM